MVQRATGKPLLSAVSALSLRQLTSEVLEELWPQAADRHTVIRNHIGRSLLLDRHRYASVRQVLSELLQTVVAHSEHGEIIISTDLYRDSVTLLIQERNNNNGFALEFKVGALQTDIARVGGYLSIDHAREKVTTISLNLPMRVAC